MSVETAKNLLIVPSIKKYGEFYQYLVTNLTNFEAFGGRLVRAADQAQAFRQYKDVKQIAQALINLPVKEYQAIGSYYLALCDYRDGHLDKAQRLFEQVAGSATRYRAKAILSLAAVSASKKDYAGELYFKLETLKASTELDTTVQAYRGIAVLRAIQGDHKTALTSLEELYPLARLSSPLAYTDYLNSFAIELCEAGRVEEARNLCKVVLASPFIRAYPEWQATARDLKGYNRSFVDIRLTPLQSNNVLALPVSEKIKQASKAPTGNHSAQIFRLQEWKQKMASDPKESQTDDKPSQELTEKQMILRMMELISSDSLSPEQMQRMLEAMEKIASETRKQM